MDERAWLYLRTLLCAALLGVPVAFAAVLFQTAIHDVTQLVWAEIPDGFSWGEPPWWYVILVPGLAGVAVGPRSAYRVMAATRRSRVSAWGRFVRPSS